MQVVASTSAVHSLLLCVEDALQTGVIDSLKTTAKHSPGAQLGAALAYDDDKQSERSHDSEDAVQASRARQVRVALQQTSYDAELVFADLKQPSSLANLCAISSDDLRNDALLQQVHVLAAQAATSPLRYHQSVAEDASNRGPSKPASSQQQVAEIAAPADQAHLVPAPDFVSRNLLPLVDIAFSPDAKRQAAVHKALGLTLDPPKRLLAWENVLMHQLDGLPRCPLRFSAHQDYVTFCNSVGQQIFQELALLRASNTNAKPYFNRSAHFWWCWCDDAAQADDPQHSQHGHSKKSKAIQSWGDGERAARALGLHDCFALLVCVLYQLGLRDNLPLHLTSVAYRRSAVAELRGLPALLLHQVARSFHIPPLLQALVELALLVAHPSEHMAYVQSLFTALDRVTALDPAMHANAADGHNALLPWSKDHQATFDLQLEQIYTYLSTLVRRFRVVFHADDTDSRDLSYVLLFLRHVWCLRARRGGRLRGQVAASPAGSADELPEDTSAQTVVQQHQRQMIAFASPYIGHLGRFEEELTQMLVEAVLIDYRDKLLRTRAAALVPGNAISVPDEQHVRLLSLGNLLSEDDPYRPDALLPAKRPAGAPPVRNISDAVQLSQLLQHMTDTMEVDQDVRRTHLAVLHEPYSTLDPVPSIGVQGGDSSFISLNGARIALVPFVPIVESTSSALNPPTAAVPVKSSFDFARVTSLTLLALLWTDARMFLHRVNKEAYYQTVTRQLARGSNSSSAAQGQAGAPADAAASRAMRRASTRHIATSSATAATPAAGGAPRSQSLMQPAGTSLMNHPAVNPVANSTGTARSVVNAAPSSVASAPISMIIPKPLLNAGDLSVAPSRQTSTAPSPHASPPPSPVYRAFHAQEQALLDDIRAQWVKHHPSSAQALSLPQAEEKSAHMSAVPAGTVLLPPVAEAEDVKEAVSKDKSDTTAETAGDAVRPQLQFKLRVLDPRAPVSTGTNSSSSAAAGAAPKPQLPRTPAYHSVTEKYPGIFEVYAALRRLYGTVQVVARPLRQDLVDCLQLHQLKSWLSELVDRWLEHVAFEAADIAQQAAQHSQRIHPTPLSSDAETSASSMAAEDQDARVSFAALWRRVQSWTDEFASMPYSVTQRKTFVRLLYAASQHHFVRDLKVVNDALRVEERRGLMWGIHVVPSPKQAAIPTSAVSEPIPPHAALSNGVAPPAVGATVSSTPGPAAATVQPAAAASRGAISTTSTAPAAVDAKSSSTSAPADSKSEPAKPKVKSKKVTMTRSPSPPPERAIVTTHAIRLSTTVFSPMFVTSWLRLRHYQTSLSTLLSKLNAGSTDNDSPTWMTASASSANDRAAPSPVSPVGKADAKGLPSSGTSTRPAAAAGSRKGSLDDRNASVRAPSPIADVDPVTGALPGEAGAAGSSALSLPLAWGMSSRDLHVATMDSIGGAIDAIPGRLVSGMRKFLLAELQVLCWQDTRKRWTGEQLDHKMKPMLLYIGSVLDALVSLNIDNATLVVLIQELSRDMWITAEHMLVNAPRRDVITSGADAATAAAANRKMSDAAASASPLLRQDSDGDEAEEEDDAKGSLEIKPAASATSSVDMTVRLSPTSELSPGSASAVTWYPAKVEPQKAFLSQDQILRLMQIVATCDEFLSTRFAVPLRVVEQSSASLRNAVSSIGQALQKPSADLIQCYMETVTSPAQTGAAILSWNRVSSPYPHMTRDELYRTLRYRAKHENDTAAQAFKKKTRSSHLKYLEDVDAAYRSAAGQAPRRTGFSRLFGSS